MTDDFFSNLPLFSSSEDAKKLLLPFDADAKKLLSDLIAGFSGKGGAVFKSISKPGGTLMKPAFFPDGLVVLTTIYACKEIAAIDASLGAPHATNEPAQEVRRALLAEALGPLVPRIKQYWRDYEFDMHAYEKKQQVLGNNAAIASNKQPIMLLDEKTLAVLKTLEKEKLANPPVEKDAEIPTEGLDISF